MNTKGQAALEFLTTYGWAFMVILVMIGALASFGVLDPSKYLPQRCQFGELNCENFALDSNKTIQGSDTSVVYFQLLNGMSETMIISQVSWRDANNPSWTECAYANFTSRDSNGGGEINLGNGDRIKIGRDEKGDFLCTSGATNDMYFEAGRREKIELRFAYNLGTVYEANYAKYLYGEISANAR